MTAFISFGGGVQSTALVVLACTGKIKAAGALFANVGDDSEHPDTLTYVRDIAVPYGVEHGLPIRELRKPGRGLWAHVMDHDDPLTTREPMPVRGMNGAPFSRSCTVDWKIKVIGRWLKDQGYGTDKGVADVMIGISTDELERAGRGKDEKYERRVYPLLDLGISRSDCKQIIRDAGLPVPPKSACFFCPFHRASVWAEMRRDEPELFAKSQQLEDVINSRRTPLGKDPVYLTRFGKRLSDAIPEAQTALFDVTDLDNPTDIGESGCDEGVCFV